MSLPASSHALVAGTRRTTYAPAVAPLTAYTVSYSWTRVRVAGVPGCFSRQVRPALRVKVTRTRPASPGKRARRVSGGNGGEVMAG